MNKYNLLLYGITLIALVFVIPFMYKIIKDFIREEKSINRMLKKSYLIIGLLLMGLIVYLIL